MEVLVLGGKNASFNVRSQQPKIGKICLYAKNRNEAKYPLLINKREGLGLNNHFDSEAFIGRSNDMDNVYENIEEYNPGKEPKKMILFDGMIVGILGIKKLNPIIIKLFIKGRTLNISLVLYYQILFC